MNKRYLIGGVIFLGIVGFVAYKVYKKKKEEKEFEEENRELKEELDKDLEIPTLSEEEKTYILNHKEEVTNSIKEKLLKNWDKPPIGEGASLEEEMAEAEHPVDSDEDDDILANEELDAMEEALESEKFYRDNKDKKPKIISSSEVGDIKGFNFDEWLYFEKDDVVTDEEENVIEDFERFVGDCLDEDGFRDDNDIEEIYILSYEYRTIYHVTKYFMSYEEKMERSSGYFNDLKAYK